MKPETQIRNIVEHVKRLAKFLAINTPSCRRMHLRRADWRVLHDNAELARRYGFTIDGEQLGFKEFTLEPTDCGSHHSKEPCRSR